jgi:predicted molibdopterin-dependent oxidoreductase YjgC
MIVIDPRRIDLVDLAELWLPLKPGTNVPVFSAMAHVIVKENLSIQISSPTALKASTEFISSRLKNLRPNMPKKFPACLPKIFAKPRACMRKQTTPQSIGAWAFRNFRTARHPRLRLINLAFLTGHIGRDGTDLNPLRGQNNVQGASDMGAMPFHYPGYMRVDNEEHAPNGKNYGTSKKAASAQTWSHHHRNFKSRA